jgi:hypothetical protein
VRHRYLVVSTHQHLLVPTYETLQPVIPKLCSTPSPSSQPQAFNSRKKKTYSMAENISLNWMDPTRPDNAQDGGKPVHWDSLLEAMAPPREIAIIEQVVDERTAKLTIREEEQLLKPQLTELEKMLREWTTVYAN